MRLETAAIILAKMGNPTRLQIVRLLVRSGDKGLAVGAIQKKLKIPGSTLTHHLSHLETAGIITKHRIHASLICRLEFDTLDDLVSYLTSECCVDAGSRTT